MRDTILPGNPELRQSLELDSLRRTRAALRAKTMNVALAVFFTTLVFCSAPAWHPLVKLLRQGGAWASTVLMIAGLFFWWRFVKDCLVLRGTGLPPVRGNGPRIAWLAGGWLVTEAVVAVVYGWKAHPVAFYFAPATAWLAVWLGEKLHQVNPSEKAVIIQPLFPPEDDDDD